MNAWLAYLSDAWIGFLMMLHAGALDNAIAFGLFAAGGVFGCFAGRSIERSQTLEDIAREGIDRPASPVDEEA
ncbi:MAG: hypothetical protein RSJ41_07700 [Clostridia bacterium]